MVVLDGEPALGTWMNDPSIRNTRLETQLAALPWRSHNGGVRVLLVTSRVSKRWLIPKGWPMKGKTDWEAAAQEALEEAGVRGTVGDVPIGSYRYLKERDDDTVPARVLVYPLRVSEVLDDWPESKQRDRDWFTLSEASKAVYEPDLARLLADLSRSWRSFLR